MKNTKFIFALMISAVFLSFDVYAQSITGEPCGDDCTWHLESGVLTVTGSGRIKGYNRDCSNLESTGRCTTDAPWFNYAENIEKVVIQNKSDEARFETIGAHAFEDMHYTQQVVLPQGLKTIENEAFHGNHALEKINLPDTLESIGNWGLSATNFSKIDIPSSVKSIGAAAFTDSNLQELIFPDGVTLTYNRICDSCENLETVIFGKNINYNKYDGEIGPFGLDTLLQNLYCPAENLQVCEKILHDSGKNDDEIQTILHSYTKDGSRYVLDGRLYQSAEDMKNGHVFIPKRIYTIDEANQVSGKTNTFSIRYR